MHDATTGWWGQAIAKWVDQIQRRALLVVLASLVLTVISAVYSFQTLSINTSTTDMISPEVPFRRNDIAFKKAFPQLRDLIVIVVDGPTPERAEEAAVRLGGRLLQEAKFKSVSVPGTEVFFQQNGLLFLDMDALSQLSDRLAAAEPLLGVLASDPTLRGFAEVLREALSNREAADSAELAALFERMGEVAEAERTGRPLNLSWESLIRASPKDAPSARRFVLAQPVLDFESLKPAEAVLSEIRRIAVDLGINAENGLRLRITGSPALDQDELESVELGGKTASLLSLLLVALLLIVGLRSVQLVVATAATLVMGLIWTASFAALSIGQLNLISVAFAVLFIGLGVDFGIHMSLRYAEEAGKGAAPGAALRRAGGGVGGALGLSAVSAAAGFYAFLPTDYRGLAELGLIAGTGMFIAMAANLTVLPALIALLPSRGHLPGHREGPSFLARLAEERGHTIRRIALILGVVGAVALPFVRFDFNPLNLQDPNAESVATFLELSKQPGSSLYNAQILANDHEAASRVAARLSALPEVGRTIALHKFVPADQEKKLRLIDDMAVFLTPVLSAPEQTPPLKGEERLRAFEEIRKRLAATAGKEGSLREPAKRLVEALKKLVAEKGDASIAGFEKRLIAYLPNTFNRLRDALSAKQVSLEDLPTDLRGQWVSRGGKVRVQAHPANDIIDNRAMRRFAEAVQSAAPNATGVPIIVTEAGRAVVSAFIEASLIALVLILAILWVVLRRAFDVILVLAPLVLAAILTAALTVLFGLSFNFANIIVLPLLLGLGVASGIHFVMRQREEREGARVLSSSTPRGVLFSGLTTIAAFGSMAFSGHLGMTSMGLLLAIAISMTLLATLVVLPSLAAISVPPSAQEEEKE